MPAQRCDRTPRSRNHRQDYKEATPPQAESYQHTSTETMSINTIGSRSRYDKSSSSYNPDDARHNHLTFSESAHSECLSCVSPIVPDRTMAAIPFTSFYRNTFSASLTNSSKQAPTIRVYPHMDAIPFEEFLKNTLQVPQVEASQKEPTTAMYPSMDTIPTSKTCCNASSLSDDDSSKAPTTAPQHRYPGFSEVWRGPSRDSQPETSKSTDKSVSLSASILLGLTLRYGK